MTTAIQYSWDQNNVLIRYLDHGHKSIFRVVVKKKEIFKFCFSIAREPDSFGGQELPEHSCSRESGLLLAVRCLQMAAGRSWGLHIFKQKQNRIF